MYSKWNSTIQTFLSGKKVPLISQQLKQIFDKLWRELDEGAFKTVEGVQYRALNRYFNILPFDKNRVKLNPLLEQGDEKSCDYINASFIKHSLVPRQYIMCQGPLEGTSEAFWKMVLQNKVKLIVMLGNFVENEREKVFEYLPLIEDEGCGQSDDSRDFNSVSVKCVDVKVTEKIMTERTLEITERGSDNKHACTHCHFSSWADFGVPAKVEYLETLLNFVQLKSASDSSPIIVHCSAGVGRSGVFVYCDIVLSLLSQSSLESVAYVEELLELRSQRMKAIQTFPQFVYALQVLRLMYPKVANWGTLSPEKDNKATDFICDNSPNDKVKPTLNVAKIREKRKFQCLSEILCSDADVEISLDGQKQSEAKKPPPCPIRTTSLMHMLKSKSVDSEPKVPRCDSYEESSDKERSPSPEQAVMFMTPTNQSEKANRSFFSLSKTDSKIMMKSKSLTKRKLGSSLRKNLMTKFKRLEKTELSVVAKPVNFD